MVTEVVHQLQPWRAPPLRRDLKQHAVATDKATRSKRTTETLGEQRTLKNHKNQASPPRPQPSTWTAPNQRIKLSKPEDPGPTLNLPTYQAVTSSPQPPLLSPGPPTQTHLHAFTHPISTTLLHLGKAFKRKHLTINSIQPPELPARVPAALGQVAFSFLRMVFLSSGGINFSIAI